MARKRLIRIILRTILVVLAIPILFLLVSLILSYIPVGERAEPHPKEAKEIFLSTNGVHLDLILHRADLDSNLTSGLVQGPSDQYFAFGWGDRNFYINTPQWADLTFGNAFEALFLKSPTLVHITRYRNQQRRWRPVSLSQDQLAQILYHIKSSFHYDQLGNKVLLVGAGYRSTDDFYEASGNYTCFHTCNSWVNDALKDCGLKACLWTPFDFALMGMYEE